MSFTIKCNECGNEDEFKAYTEKGKKPIIISTGHYGDAPDWYIMECTKCGHKVEAL
jgi:uncharacterized Zn finger protein